MNERTARRYMGVTEALGSKSDTVSVLPPTALYALAAPSTPAPIREAVVTALRLARRSPRRDRERVVNLLPGEADLSRRGVTVTTRNGLRPTFAADLAPILRGVVFVGEPDLGGGLGIV